VNQIAIAIAISIATPNFVTSTFFFFFVEVGIIISCNLSQGFGSCASLGFGPFLFSSALNLRSNYEGTIFWGCTLRYSIIRSKSI